MSESYSGQQFVGIDLHRRRSVIVRMTTDGDPLECIRISNDVERLTTVMARAGEAPEVVLEATYGWYWAVDALQEQGAQVHLAHPLGVKAFEYRRVKNDERDARDLADLLRMGRLPGGVDRAAGDPGTAGAGAAPGQAGRDAQQLQGPDPRGAGQVRHPGVDDRPVRPGRAPSCWTGLQLPKPYAARIASLRRIIDGPGFRDRRVRRAGPGPAGPRPRVRRGAEPSPVSARSWGRCSSPRSVTCTGSPGRRS